MELFPFHYRQINAAELDLNERVSENYYIICLSCQINVPFLQVIENILVLFILYIFTT